MTSTTAIVGVPERAVKVRARIVAAFTDAVTEAGFGAVPQFAALTSGAPRAARRRDAVDRGARHRYDGLVGRGD